MPQRNKMTEDENRNPDAKPVRRENKESRRMEVRAKDTPGVICLERHTHDEAIVITGSLVVDITDEDLTTWIAQELETAGAEIRKSGGTVGEIKTTLTVASTSMISLSDEAAVIRETSQSRARITLAAILHKMDSGEAVQIIRQALAAVRRRLRQEKG